MTENPNWPSYPIGPKDSIFALGIVSVNYAQLEFAVYGMLSVILGIQGEVASHLMFKFNPEMRDKLMREILPTCKWPIDAADRSLHFIEAHKICYENRNKLAHSNLHVLSPNAILLAKIGRNGKSTLANPLLSELRQVADDMHVYFQFGMWLSNMIKWDVLNWKPQEGDQWHRTWPDKPPLPIPLEYTSNPRPIRPLR